LPVAVLVTANSFFTLSIGKVFDKYFLALNIILAKELSKSGYTDKIRAKL
jgi:hypothetical protein